MILHPSDRAALLIDRAIRHATAGGLNARLDVTKRIEGFRQRTALVRPDYDTPSTTREGSPA